MKKEKQNILVAGAYGTTGRIIVQLLNESEYYTPIAMVRKQQQKDCFEQQHVLAVVVDLEGDVSPALKNVSKVIFAAGSKGKNVIGVDQEGAKRLTDAAKESGANKFVMLSTMGADNPAMNNNLEDYLRAKQHADNYLKISGLNYSIVRPGALSDEEGTGKIELQQKIKNHGSITRADVAKTLVEVLKDGRKENEVFEILAGETPIENAVTQ